MEQQNILSQEQNKIDQTQNLMNQNLLSQSEQISKKMKNQEKSLSQINDFNQKDIHLSFDLTIKRKVQSQIHRRVNQTGIFQKATCQVINQKDIQYAFISYQKDKKQSSFEYLSFSSNQKQRLKSSNNDIIQVQQAQNISKKLEQQSHNQQQITCLPQTNKQKEDQNIDNKQQNISKMSFKENQLDEKKHELKEDVKQEDQKSSVSYQIQIKDQNKASISCADNNQSKQNILDQQNQKEMNNKNIKQKLFIDESKIFDNQVQRILSEIEEYDFKEYQQNQEDEETGIQIVVREWSQDIFDKLSWNKIQSKHFETKKLKIFEVLSQKQLFLSKILHSNEKEDLILGYIKEGLLEQDYIFNITHNQTESERDSNMEMINSLGFLHDHILIEQDGLSILIIQKEKFEQLVKFKQNIQLIGNIYEINSNNFEECKLCQDQNTCQSRQCFKNVKSLILSFLKNKKLSYCEYQNNLISGILFKQNQQQIIPEYQYFVQRIIFSFYNDSNNESDQQNKYQQKQTNLSETKLEQKQEKEQIVNIELINGYQFEDYQFQNNYDLGSEVIFNNSQRDWDITKFNQTNLNQTSENFQKYQNDIFEILNNKKYFLCKSLGRNSTEDVFLGYQEEISQKYQDQVFIIKYNHIDQVLQKYLIMLSKFNEEYNYFIINNFIHILILQKDIFLQISNNFENLNTQIEGIGNYLDQVKQNKILNQQYCNNCQNCNQKQECQHLLSFSEFQKEKYTIVENLVKKSYYIKEYLNIGGEGIIFRGYKQSFTQKQNLVFKILFGCNQEELQKEIQIMKCFEICVIKFIDFVKINDKINVLVLEECQFSLREELDQLKSKKVFPLNKLLQMVFNLLDGLIQLRIYNVLHLDIKPQNILVTKSGKYVYTDFGISCFQTNDQEIHIKGMTWYYASPEQLKEDPNIDYQSDIFSLGKTFQNILKAFKEVQLQNYSDIISQFENIVQDSMLQIQSKLRSNCLDLLNLFFQKILIEDSCQQFLLSYLDQMNTILNSYTFDKNKEIPYFLQIMITYNLNIIAVYKQSIEKNPQIDVQNQQQNIAASLSQIGLCYEKLGDNQKALKQFEESLQIFKQIYKENHLNIASSLNNVGVCYKNLGNNQKALEYFEESLQMVKQIFKYNNPHIAIFLNNIGLCYKNVGDNKKALEYFEQSLQIKKQLFKSNSHDIATSLNNIGNCYQNSGDNKKALEYFEESLETFKLIFKENHPDIAASLNNVGICYQSLNDYKRALEYLGESLQMRKQIFKKNHPEIAISMNNVGLCYQNLGDNKKSFEYFEGSLQMLRQIFKENHPDLATSLNNIGLFYKNNGDNKKALECFEESLKIYKYIFKENHPDIALSLNNVGICYQNLSDHKKALQYFEESLQIFKQIFKENHPDIAQSLNNLGSCYQNLGDNKKALQNFEESLKMKKQILEQNHPDIAVSLNNIGNCYQDIGDIKKALEYFEESLLIFKQIFQQNHPNIASSLNNIGICYLDLGDRQKALEYFEESLQIRKQIYQKNHPDIALSLNNIGNCYQDDGNYKKALEYFEESLQMKKQIFSENHPDIATSLNCVGVCYQNLGNNKKALEYFEESYKIFKLKFKDNHPDIALSLNNKGSCYLNLGDYESALDYFEESLKMFKQVFKENHPDIAQSLNNVGICYYNLGDNKKALEYFKESIQIFKEKSPYVASSLNSISNCYRNIGDNKMALEYALKSLQMRKQIFKQNHPDVALSLHNVGLCYKNLGDNKQALECSLKSLQMRKQIFEENHPLIASSISLIGLCYKGLGDLKIFLEYFKEYVELAN